MHLGSRAEQKKPGQSPPDKITAIGGILGKVKKPDGEIWRKKRRLLDLFGNAYKNHRKRL
jgi:hypothetical protein